ncbi:negative regulation of centriole-centriole cohesion [Trichomonas vaginalis G3]|uniref:negative regulation of centriole-centriole cohesion n=1 Tax=Trichomonas vaginalis (strain ATCC PRA-98 / G3) TaxID=412133 RepID=UPI0021E5329B|nr:negative regulation of centriole-centriole cohesion [Trichomonas vaginalis G3]KAI5509865.1 negative regulation of centriole-centriole cohesion [Trichomonas vaginalis G3]
MSFSDTTIPAGDRNQAAANFTHFFTFIKEGINTKVCDVSELLKLLRAIMKENFYIGMNSCIAMGYDEDPTVRTAFLDGLTNFFSADVYQKIVAFNQKETLIDLLMGGDFDLVKLLASKVPTHQSEEFGRQLTAAAAYKGREFEFFQAMVELELTNSTIVYATEEELNRTTLFRGNGTPSKVFSAYIQMVANEWLLGLMTPIIRKVTLLAESGVSFHIDQTRLDPHENINENREQFRQVFSDFVNQFENNIETMPRGLIKAAQILYNSIVNQSQFVAVQAIASFIFLRFICPTLIEPTRAGYTEAIPEQTRTCLVHLSSLLMVAAVRNRVDAKRPHYAYFANTVQAAYKKLRSCYDRIVSLRITEVPHVLAIDPTAVIISLQKLIAPLIPIVDQILQELKEDNPLRESILVFMSKLRETEQMSESLQSQINNNDVHNGQDFNPVLNKILEKTFYKTDFISIKGDEVFYLDMSTFVVQIPLNQIINHILKTLKGYENSRYTIVCDIGNVDLNILPSPKELIKAASQIPDYIVKNISHIYVVRIPPNFAKYFSETVLMNALPPLEMIETIDAFKNEVSQHTLILGYAAYEGLLPHDAIYSCEYNGEKSTVLLTQQAIVVTSKSKYIKGNTRVVIPYRNFKNIKVSDHPNNNKFFILDKDDCVHNFSVATNSSLFDDIQECLKRSKLITTTRNLIYVERPTLRMLLLNVALINLVSDMADFNVRRSALELIEKTINSTEIKSTIDFSKYANSNYVGSVYEIAEEISDDISRNNSQDVHTFFTEFAKTITYLNHNDFCISSTYLVPWMKNCGEAAIENKRTLDSLAQITASIPQADTCQFTQMFWGSITEEKLFKTLLQMTSEFGNSSSISLFITISNNSKRLTSAITKIMEEENGMTIFFQAARTLISLIIAGTFDEECYPDLLHIIHTAIYNKRTEMTTNLLETIYQKYVGKPDFKASDFNDDLAKKEFKQWTTRASKLSHVIYDIADNAKLDKQKLISLFNSDISTESNDNMQFLSSLLLLCLLDNNSEVYKRKAISLVQTGKPQQIMIGFEALSYLNLTDKESIAFIIGGLLNICSSQSEFSINMVIETTNKFIRNFGISKLKTDEYLTNEIIQRISAESNLPFTQGLVHTMIGIDFVFDSENKLIHLLETQGFENDLLKCFTTTNSQEMVDCFKRTQECAFILLWRFCQRPDDKSTIQGLSEIIRMNQDIFSNLNLQIVYDACERASSPDVLKLLIELARSQKSKKPGKKAGNLFTLFLEKSSVQTLNDDAVSHMISTIYKSIS